MEPEEIFAHHLLALLFTARGQYEEAKRTIENVLEMFPNDITSVYTDFFLIFSKPGLQSRNLHPGDVRYHQELPQ